MIDLVFGKIQNTRQMIIAAWGEPELCCSMAQCGMLSKGVGSMHTCTQDS